MAGLDIRPSVLFVLGLLAALKAAALVGMAEAIATGVVSVIDGSDGWRMSVAIGLASGLVRALATWAAASYSTRASLGAKERLRHDLAARLLTGSGVPAGSAGALGAVGLDELDNYYRIALPAVVSAATLPLLVGARILFADPLSAVIIVVTVPLVPVFMALVGLHTRDRADAASASLQRLSNHLVELARGLPVLVGLGRVEEQSAALRAVSVQHRTTTMATLRTAFLSSLVLELISTISVAVVAVFVGVRLVSGDLPLAIGLVALVLAPECFAPFRELGAAFHSSQDGLAAMRGAKALIDAPSTADRRTADATACVRGLVVFHDDRRAPVIDGLDFDLAPGTITSIEGASGSGKSTVLGVLAGLVPFDAGSVSGIDAALVAWVPQHPHTIATTVFDEVHLYANDAGAVDDALRALGLAHLSAADPARLSPGELRRLAVARGLVRVAAGATLLLLDEPTAHLDPASARLVERAIAGLRGITIVIASHEEGMTRLADRRILLGRQGGMREVDEGIAVHTPASESLVAAGGPTLPELGAFLRPVLWRSVGAVLLGAAASLAAISLTAVSGWLIVRASEHPPIMYLLVAIVGVRFFGLARAGLRYAERLTTHGAVLGAIVELRQRLWAGLARNGVASRAIATGSSAVDHLVASADRVRDLVPRVLMPPAVALVVSLSALTAVAALLPAAVPLLLGTLLVCLVVAPTVAMLADRHAAARIGATRSQVLREFVSMVDAADELRANGVGARMLARLTALDDTAGRLSRSTAWALGLGNAVVVLACSATAMFMLPTALGMPGPIVAVLVLLPLALVEPLTAVVDAVQQWPALAAALRRVRAVSEGSDASGGADVERIESLRLDRLVGSWGTTAAFGPVDAVAVRGDWIVVEGPSGAGKSTLLATLLGYLPAASGSWSVNGVDARTYDPARLRSRVAWCPQESHLFDSTIRGNLLLARARDDRPTDAEMLRALSTAGLDRLLSTLPDGLDARVGSAGQHLSGGERQRLAVARTLLTRADVVLLDEPTAHLDADSARRLMLDLRRELQDRIVVLVSHHSSERLPGDVRVLLGGLPDDGTEQVRGDGGVHRFGVARVVDAREHVPLQPGQLAAGAVATTTR